MVVVQKLLTSILLVGAAGLSGQPDPACRIQGSARFNGNGETVRLVREVGQPSSSNLAIFRAPLAVNTDGAPTSYHPDDFTGERLAINRIDNGMHFYRVIGQRQQRLTFAESRRLFDKWRSANWVIPAGYKISWTGPIAAREGKPCIFQRGPNAGYFGSLTALQNGLPTGQRGECDVDNQLDLRLVPAIALRGTTNNPLWTYGARKGDLVVAINPANSVVVAAIIGDTGDANRIGEGSVALNQQLLGRPTPPKTYTEARHLDTGTRDIVVAVLPNSRTFEVQRPYTASSIRARVEAWARHAGYTSIDALATRAVSCSQGL